MAQVDILVTGGTLVPMASQETMQDGALAIKDGIIVAVGTASAVAQQYHASTSIDAHDRLVLPGLINGHTHIGMTMMRGIADDALTLQDWLNNYIFPLEKKILSHDFVYWSTILACYEMIQSGITLFADMYFFESICAQAVEHAGMRALLGETIFIEEDIEHAQEFFHDVNGHRLIQPAFAPHSLYSCSAQTLTTAYRHAMRAQVPFIIHAAEQQDELYQLYKTTGKSPVEYMESLGILSERVIIAHGVHFSDTDLKILATYGASIVYNPSSNVKLGSGIAHVKSMQEHNIFVGLGTDGTASNNSLDEFSEMKIGALLQKLCLSGYCKPLTPFEIVKLATSDGAHALKMGDKVGTLEVGKRADLIIMNSQALRQLPDFNVYSQIVYASNTSDVQTVIVNGKIIMRDRAMLTLAPYETELRKKIAFYKAKILNLIAH